MIKIFYGEDRIKAKAEIARIFGKDYEVVEGVDLTADMLPSVMNGGSLLAEKRKILITDLGENKPAWEKLPEYVTAKNEIILLESKLDKRTAAYKEIKDKVKVKEFARGRSENDGLVFEIYKTAKRDGKKAVEMLEKIEMEQDPYMLMGLIVSQAVKDFSYRQGSKEKRALVELSKLDIAMKTTQLSPFVLLKGFLLQVTQWS